MSDNTTGKEQCAGMIGQPCDRPLTHVDAKGYAYCTRCAAIRSRFMRVKKLKVKKGETK